LNLKNKSSTVQTQRRIIVCRERVARDCDPCGLPSVAGTHPPNVHMNDDCRYEMILVVEAAEGTPEEGVLRSSEAATADQIAAEEGRVWVQVKNIHA